MSLLEIKTNIANSYAELGRMEQSMQLCRDVYAGHLKLNGEEHPSTLSEANNYADCLLHLSRFEEAKALMRKTIPMAQRILGLGDQITRTLKIRGLFAEALSKDPAATLDDLHEAVTTLEDVQRIARRVLGAAHPMTVGLEQALRISRAALRFRETAETPLGNA